MVRVMVEEKRLRKHGAEDGTRNRDLLITHYFGPNCVRSPGARTVANPKSPAVEPSATGRYRAQGRRNRLQGNFRKRRGWVDLEGGIQVRFEPSGEYCSIGYSRSRRHREDRVAARDKEW
jgi:hypothetical protein